MLWHASMEMLSFLLPLINFQKVWNMTKKKLFKYSPDASESDLQPSQCTVCRGEIICAFTSDCSHNFCYFCLASNIQKDSEFKCPKCNTNLSLIKPLLVKYWQDIQNIFSPKSYSTTFFVCFVSIHNGLSLCHKLVLVNIRVIELW